MINIQHELKNHWDLKIADNMQWNDCVREEEFRDFINSTKKMIINSLFKETKLQMWQTTRQKKLNRKKFFRKRLRFEIDNLTLTLRECEACWFETNNSRLIKENAKQVIIAKLQKEKNNEKKRVNAQFMKFWRMKRNDVHAKNVVVHKTKKARIKQIKVSIHLSTISIRFDLIKCSDHASKLSEWKRYDFLKLVKTKDLLIRISFRV